MHRWIRDSKKFFVSPRGREFAKNFQIAFKQPKNLRKMVAGCKPKQGGEGGSNTPQEKGSFKCKKCHACPVVENSKRFQSTNTQRIYPIRQKMDCNSSYLVYLATCRKCKGQYVGKSQTAFKTRHSNHKQEIKHGKGGLGHYYGPKGKCNYENISFTLIEKVAEGDKVMLARREQFWQHQLRAYSENGGNAHCIRKELI